MCVLLITRLLRGVGRWVRKPANHTSWVAVVTPTDRPKSVRNCCLIELFVALFVLLLCPFDISVSIGVFVIGLGQISSFLSVFALNMLNTTKHSTRSCILIVQIFIRGASPGMSYKLWNIKAVGERRWDIATQERKLMIWKLKSSRLL